MIDSDLKRPFLEHLEELRWRLVKSLFAILIGGFITYAISDEIINILLIPADSLKIKMDFQILKVTSMFSIKLSVALFGGLILGSPIISFQFWRFISPVFKGNYGKYTSVIIFFSLFLFVIGMVFAYYLTIPFSLAFFTSISADNIPVNYNFVLEGYLIYVLWIIFGCGLLFQLPVISFFLTRIGIFTPDFLRHYRKFSIIFLLIISSVLTPPDPLSLIIIVIPLLLLYELSIIISRIFSPKDLLK